MGIGRVVERKSTMLGKWLWSFPRVREASWAKVVKGIHRLTSYRWDNESDSRATLTSPWKFILTSYKRFDHSSNKGREWL